MAPRSRIDLHAKMVEVFGINNIYFQPPNNITLKYPCVIYSRIRHAVTYADNGRYSNKARYSVMIIDRDPDSILSTKALNLEYCTLDRHFVSDNLNHDVYNLYY